MCFLQQGSAFSWFQHNRAEELMGPFHHLISSDFSLEAAAIRLGLHLSLGLHHLTLLHSPSVPFISKGDSTPVPVQMDFSVWCFCAPLFIISIKLQSYVETLVAFTSHCAKCAARKQVFASKNSQVLVLSLAALPVVVMSTAVTAVISTCLHGAGSNLSFTFHILFPPSSSDFLPRGSVEHL